MLLFVLLIASLPLHGQADTILLCRQGQQVMLSATAGQFAYQWSPATGLSNPTVANPTVQPTATTWYVARIIGETESDNLIQNPNGNDFALEDFAFFKIQDVILDSTLVLISETMHSPEIIRKPDCGARNGSIAVASVSNGPARFAYSLDGGAFGKAAIFTGLSAGTHTVTVRNDHPTLAGEAYQETLEIELSQGDCPVYLPTAFSPNGDGINDDFRVFSHAGFFGNVRSLVVYDRWGGTVFSVANSTLDAARWDGRVGEKTAPAGTYLYVLELDNGAGVVRQQRGTVVVLR